VRGASCPYFLRSFRRGVREERKKKKRESGYRAGQSHAKRRRKETLPHAAFLVARWRKEEKRGDRVTSASEGASNSGRLVDFLAKYVGGKKKEKETLNLSHDGKKNVRIKTLAKSTQKRKRERKGAASRVPDKTKRRGLPLRANLQYSMLLLQKKRRRKENSARLSLAKAT